MAVRSVCAFAILRSAKRIVQVRKYGKEMMGVKFVNVGTTMMTRKQKNRNREKEGKQNDKVEDGGRNIKNLNKNVVNVVEDVERISKANLFYYQHII